MTKNDIILSEMLYYNLQPPHPADMSNQNNELIVGQVPLFSRADMAEKRYSRQPIGDLDFWTIAFDEGDNVKFAELFNHKMTSTQSVITVALPNGQEYYLTGKFRERPFVAGVFGDLIVVQIQENVCCLSISANLAIRHSFTLSKPVHWYGDASLNGNRLTVNYVRLGNVNNSGNANFVSERETFNLTE